MPRPATVRLLADAFALTGVDRDLFGQAAVGGSATQPPPNGHRVPAQLPADVSAFTGREEQLVCLDAILAGQASPPATVAISVIAGTAGVGKTALAVHWAHQVADRFPDGQLYVNLRGFGPAGQATEPAKAVRLFLDALDIPPNRIPADLDAQAALYRSEMAGRRMLIVLDNARNTAQVQPLLPGAPGCLVLVTSRNRLSGLVAGQGATPLSLDVLSVDEAHELLTRRIGADRIEAEPDVVNTIIDGCARLPLALAVAAARAATTPNLPLAALADQLRDGGQRLDALGTGEENTNVQAVFSWSYQALTPPAAMLFRLLGLHPGPDITAPAAASLTGTGHDAVRPLLAELARTSLLVEQLPGRYTFHDLLRAYAAHLAQTTDDDQRRRAATGRILDHYLHTAYAAHQLLDTADDPIRLDPPRPGVGIEHPTDLTCALDWFAAEYPVLLATVDYAAATAFDVHAWRLAWTLWTFLARRGRWHDQVSTGKVAVAAAQRLADPDAEARAHHNLAGAYRRLGRYGNADIHLNLALDAATRSGDQTTQARTHYNLAILWDHRGRPAEALHHARQALRMYQATGHQTGQARALNTVGWCHALLGDPAQALTHCQQALALHQHLGDRVGQADTWDSLGYAHHQLGQHARAISCYQHALRLFQDLGDRHYEAVTLARLGDTHHAASHTRAARAAWQQALTILDELHHPDADNIRAKLSPFSQTRRT